MTKLVDIREAPLRRCLDILLLDKTTKKTIIWATDSYQSLGKEYQDNMHMDPGRVLEAAHVMKPRIQKTIEDQTARTRKRAEVFTPSYIVNHMNNDIDEDWFGRSDVFNIERGVDWESTTDPIEMPTGKDWKAYVDSRRLEITCGEGPYLVSRYDAATGEEIPLNNRMGLLDRKLRIVTENAHKDEWVKWAVRAVESVYGYEYQGDNLLIARINVFITFIEYYLSVFQTMPKTDLLRSVAHKIAWNLWQMDGLSDKVPLGKHFDPEEQISFFTPPIEEHKEEVIAYPCIIRNWRSKTTETMRALKERDMSKKLFDYVIGNPPYQIEASGTSTSDKPVYHLMMESAYDLANKALFITPARFLFNAGATPKGWNEKMLNDEHLKVLQFSQDSSAIFPNTDIKGGLAITYRDTTQKFKKIEVFTSFDELNKILQNVVPTIKNGNTLDKIIYTQNKFNLGKLNQELPDLKRKDKRLESNIFKLPVFKEKKEKNDLCIIGLQNMVRTKRFISSELIDMNHGNLEKFKVILPKSNGSGALGEVLSTPLIGEPLIGEPLIGYTRTFIGIGAFDDLLEAENALKYIKTKFARTLLGLLKITQDNNPEKWKYVPLQDFTSSSDIDWSASVADIDRQLYRKYNLSSEEIDFIESHVKEMV
ncbi:Eco57I restriction-modification methylase domain-containing protein [Aedoeadaptatus coxii]|uniref:Eco57I restriction-modification methylase domain-containing protein n=1 Tax=Aedoeadaptatus coxii TaxID=755172 RepID=UPI002AD23B2C|nr:Eco57I restriction-modification methylase domain-containing protein [Peptoniphilus coxii]